VENKVYFPKDVFFNRIAIAYENKDANFPLSKKDEDRLYLQYFMKYPVSRFAYPDVVNAWIFNTKQRKN
jgi:hypothetical protein